MKLIAVQIKNTTVLVASLMLVAGHQVNAASYCDPFFDDDCEEQSSVKAPSTAAFKTIQLNEATLLDGPFPQQNEKQSIYNFDKYKVAVSEDIGDENEAVKKAAQRAVAELKIKALRQTATEINSILTKPLSSKELDLRVEKAASIHKNFIDEFKLLGKETDSTQMLFTMSRPKHVILTGYFKINRAALKSFMVDTVRTVTTSVSEEDVLSISIPTSTDATFISPFNNATKRVPDDAVNHKATMTKLVNELKLKALNEAADEVNHALAQPMDFDEFNRAIRKANKNSSDYISDWRLTNQVVDQRETYSGTIESIRLSGWFSIDKTKLRRALIKDRAIITVAKYRTYVEALWNVKDKDVNPEVMNVVIGNIEDQFSQSGYEIVEFERIKGDLVELMNKDEVSGIYSNNELERFIANLELRNIDSKFENGKRILADYADLLIGVTINSMEVSNRMMKVRLTVNATLFENGEWMKLASTDRTGSIPYVRGDTESLIAVAKRVALSAAESLEKKARKQISLRKTIEIIKLDEEREFTLVFNTIDAGSFRTLRKAIKGGSNWTYKGADPQRKIIRLGYRGQIDGLSDAVEDFLVDTGIKPGIPEFSSGRNRIIFGKE
jgi:hypothetical protein